VEGREVPVSIVTPVVVNICTRQTLSKNSLKQRVWYLFFRISKIKISKYKYVLFISLLFSLIESQIRWWVDSWNPRKWVSSEYNVLHSTRFVTRLRRRVPLVEQELLTLPEHLSSPRFIVRFVLRLCPRILWNNEFMVRTMVLSCTETLCI
jgi:hypothetical protein